MAFPTAILLISCPDRPGIIARVSNLLYSLDCNIIDSDQHTDDADGHFFWRIFFESQSRTVATVIAEIGAALPRLFTEMQLHWELFDAAYRERIVIMVSKLHHCMMDLLSRHHSGELDAEVAAVISNHPGLEALVKPFGIPFFVIPVAKESKPQAERELARPLAQLKCDTPVPAPYIELLSGDFLS